MISLLKSAAGTATGGFDEVEHPELSRVRAVSTLLDDSLRVPGTDIRFGLDPVLGVLPVAGDSVSSLISLYIIAEGYWAGAPGSVLAKMGALAAVDFFVGSIPVIGPVFDAFWKNNKWNVNMLQEYLEEAA